VRSSDDTFWARLRNDPRMAESPVHGRPGYGDQVDAVYTAATRDEARDLLAAMSNDRLYHVAHTAGYDYDVTPTKRAGYIEALLDCIRGDKL
jgi:hypothetical protein